MSKVSKVSKQVSKKTTHTKDQIDTFKTDESYETPQESSEYD